MTTSLTPSNKTQERTRRRNRRLVVGAGVGVGTALLLLWLSRDAKASAGDDPGEEDDGGGGGDPKPEPEPGRDKRGGRGGLRSVGDGEPPKPTPDPGNVGPGGTVPGVDVLPDPKKDPLGPASGGGKRTNPKGGGKTPKTPKPKGDGGTRTNPKPKGDGGTRTNPKPKGPNPGIKDLPRYYNDEWPDPGKFYQVGSQDADGLYGIAWRWFFTCLFLAARNAGGLSEEEARAWASARVGPKGVAQAERADYVLCVAWNDVTYGSFTVVQKNRRGPHGRGIDLVPQHADNWKRLRQAKRARRNVELGEPGEVGTPKNAGKGNARLPLLWMPRLDDAALWDSDGQTLVAAGTWSDGSSFTHPPPVVMALGIDDVTHTAQLGVWGCGDGQQHYGAD